MTQLDPIGQAVEHWGTGVIALSSLLALCRYAWVHIWPRPKPKKPRKR